jgi:hypothetical protein
MRLITVCAVIVLLFDLSLSISGVGVGRIKERSDDAPAMG